MVISRKLYFKIQPSNLVPRYNTIGDINDTSVVDLKVRSKVREVEMSAFFVCLLCFDIATLTASTSQMTQTSIKEKKQ